MQFWIKLCNCVLVVGLLCGYQAIQNHRTQEEEIAKLEAQLQQQAIAAEDTETVDSPYQDGVYEGEAQGYGGTVAVELTIENGKFTDLTVVSAEKEDAAYFDAASSLLDTILEEQSTDVDTVSGATFSSNGIIHATEDALKTITTPSQVVLKDYSTKDIVDESKERELYEMYIKLKEKFENQES